MKNIKIIIIVISFLLLLPFRLPVSVLLISLFNYIAQLGSTVELSHEILRANVIMTKIIYNIVFSVILVINVEKLSKDIKGRGPRTELTFWWTAWIIGLLSVYLIFDGYWIYKLFNQINNG